ncbi:MAG TPA: hypothetical protein VF030_01115 [Solirubrobacterales bacterium]
MGEVEELLRVNAELAAEIRALSGERVDRPRSGQVPAARGIARLVTERDALAARLAEAEAAAAQTEAALEQTRASRDGLERQNREMAAEIARLSSGFSGLLRRARGRLLSR